MTCLILIGACTASGESGPEADIPDPEGLDADGLDEDGLDGGGVNAAGPDADDPAGTSDCLVLDDGASAGDGNFEVRSMELVPGSDGASVYYPAAIAESSCTFYVIGWGNGTSSVGGEAYPEYFQRLASHGFVVAVAHTNFAADGPVILDTAARVLALNNDPESVFFGKLEGEYGVMGKSQGAIAAARDVETDPNAVAAVMVAGSRGTLTRPALFATGTADFLREMTFNGFESATGEALYAEARDIGHLDLDDFVPVAQLATSFMRCHLQGDAKACAYLACVDCQVEPWATYVIR